MFMEIEMDNPLGDVLGVEPVEEPPFPPVEEEKVFTSFQRVRKSETKAARPTQ